MSASRRLRQAWAVRGNPPCAHERLAKEVSDVVPATYGWDTGDDVCLRRGLDMPRRWWREQAQRQVTA